VDAFQALDTAIRRGLVSARTQRGGAGQLTAAIDLKLTESGVGFLSQHRRSVSHPGEGTSPQTALDPSLPARVQRRTQFIHRI
jgi:hypothetical protein